MSYVESPQTEVSVEGLRENFESVACVLCGSSDAVLVVKAPDRYLGTHPGVWFHVVRCRGCGLQFQSPRPTHEHLATLYPEEYYAYQPAKAKVVPRLKAFGQRLERWSKRGLRQAFFAYPGCATWERWFLRVVLWPLWIRMKLLGKDLKVMPFHGQGRFLDVGCGSGRDLAYQRSYGLTVTGVEFSHSAARAARDHHALDVRAGTLEEARFPDSSFDLVHLSHVIEHVPDPAATLDEIHRILDTRGMVIMKLPNMASAAAKRYGTYWLGLDLPRHLYHFTPDSISEMLKRHGFAVEAIRQDVGVWGFNRESRRFQVLETSGQILGDSWWRDRVDQVAELVACWRCRGSALAVYARKTDAALIKGRPLATEERAFDAH